MCTVSSEHPASHIDHSLVLCFRIGLEQIYQLTRNGSHILRVTLKDWSGNTAHAEYSNFRVDDEAGLYRLRYGSFIGGTAGDALGYGSYPHKNQAFSTPDNDNDNTSTDCAGHYRSGWWFNGCFAANLNGRRLTSSNIGETRGIHWWTWKNQWYSMKRASMKIRRVA